MLPASTGIKESVRADKLWSKDIWQCSMCGQLSQDYPQIGFEPVSEKIFCNICLYHYWDIDGQSWAKYRLDEKRMWTYLPKEPEPDRPKEYWYYWVWSLAPNYTIEDVRSNIDKFIACKLGIFYCDISLEHGEKTGREHYNMRIKAHKCIKGQRVKRYEKAGKIHKQTIRKQTQENWDNVGTYCTKENDIQILIDR